MAAVVASFTLYVFGSIDVCSVHNRPAKPRPTIGWITIALLFLTRYSVTI